MPSPRQRYPKGLTIIGMRRLTTSELDHEGWNEDERVLALLLSDGSMLYASADAEGNRGGALFGRGADGTTFLVALGR